MKWFLSVASVCWMMIKALGPPPAFLPGTWPVSVLEVRKLAVPGLKLHLENDSDVVEKALSVQYPTS